MTHIDVLYSSRMLLFFVLFSFFKFMTTCQTCPNDAIPLHVFYFYGVVMSSSDVQ